MFTKDIGMFPRHFLTGLLSIFMIQTICLPVLADTIMVNPTQVYINKPFTAGIVTLQNTGTNPTRVQVTVSSWEQQPNEKMALTPTNDILVYPSLLEIPAGGLRQIRIGTARPLSAKEHAYRLIIHELKASKDATQGAHISLLTNIDLPVFVSNLMGNPSNLQVQAHGDSKNLIVNIHNNGDIHTQLRTLEITGYDKQKKPIIYSKQEAWYVLANTEQEYTLALSKSICQDLSTVTITVISSKNIVNSWSINPIMICRGT
jgi:fimbrial chaperone protein